MGKAGTGGRKGGGKSPSTPIGKFSLGKGPLTLSSGKKDARHHIIVMGLCPGLVVCWMKKFNKEEEPFLGPYIRLLEDDPAKMEELGISAILKRRGEDGNTEMPQQPGGNFPWRAFLLTVPEDCNTPESREEAVQALMDDFNSKAQQPLFKHPQQVKWGRDVTGDSPRPADVALLDRDVCQLMASGHQIPLEEVKEDASEMAKWWEDAEQGAAVMENCLATIDFYNHDERLVRPAPEE